MPKLTEDEFDELMVQMITRFVESQEKLASAAAFQAQVTHETSQLMARGIELQEKMLAQHEEQSRIMRQSHGM